MKNFKKIFREYLKAFSVYQKTGRPLQTDHPSYIKMKQEIEYLDIKRRLLMKQLAAEDRVLKYESQKRIESF
jgi:hypothetical protein